MFAGWKIVAVAFLVATFAWGIGFYGLGVYLVVLHDRSGWPVSLISIAITGYYVLSAAMITLVGDAFDRFGPRKRSNASTRRWRVRSNRRETVCSPARRRSRKNCSPA